MLRPCLRRLGALLIGVWLWLWDSGWRLLSYFRHRRIARRVHHPLLLNSATALGRKIRAREVTSVELVKAMVERIQEIAYLNAVALPNYEATLDEARTVDRRVAAGNVPSAETAPFFGVPFTLKDAVFVRGLRCTAGIPARGAVSAAAEDSEAVRNLRLAGAIGPLAVTNVSEVCMWWESTNGLFGRSCNPYDHRRIVGGSSGGEGCLIAAGGSIFGIGSDIGGSIRMPAFFNGIFGHKPSKFVVSDHGAFPPTHGYQKTMFSKGPMCRYAEDLAPMLRALGGPAAEAQLRLSERPVPFPRLRIFYMEGIRSRFISSLHPDMLEAMRKVIRYMETRYESACIRLDLPLAHKALPIYFNDLDVEEAPDFAEIMTDHTGRVSPLREMVKLTRGQSPHTFAALLLCLFEEISNHHALKPGPEEKAKLVLLRDRLCKELESLLGDDGVLLFPSHPTAAPFHHQPLGQPFNFIYTGLFNSLALPVTQVPLGLGSDGVPLGLQVVGGNGKDRVTLGLAEELERAFGGWVNFSR